MGIYTIGKEQKDEIRVMIVDVLKERQDIIFAYLYGSFLGSSFRDIDIAVYVEEIKRKRGILGFELVLERELEELISFPIDVRILNYAPLSFKFKVIKEGILLFSRDEEVRSDFECLTFVEHHDFLFHRETYRREALGII